ncbi:MAG: DUF362 domain-containing protein [Negativicutes bacterium]
MEQAKVYFTDFRTPVGIPLTDKLKKLCRLAGFNKMEMEGKFVAIKMHFGELGNLAYLRPNYARAVAELVKEKGGRPFLTDCNTLYPGSRKHALEHLDCANLNGFNPTTTGCQILIADGLRGTDEVEVPVKNGQYVKAAKIGRALMDADIVISLAHFKGHEMTGFGGSIKNLGMGGGSRAGKMEQHSSGKVVVDAEKCRGCRRCAPECGSSAIHYENNKAVIDPEVCKGCGRCIGACPFDALSNDQWDANDVLDRKMAEYTQAICQDRPTFHINMAMDISPNCDCHGDNDAPILPNLGIFTSFDPVACDQAAADACQKATPLSNSQLSDHLTQPDWQHHHDVFLDSNPHVNWEETLIHAEKIGLGTRRYELVTMK